MDGTWCNVPSEKELMTRSYFQEVYTKDPTLTPDVVIESIEEKVTPEMNELLCAPFTNKEIDLVIRSLGILIFHPFESRFSSSCC